MPTARADSFRLLRTKSSLADDTDWTTSTPPSGSDVVSVSTSTKPINAAYLYYTFLDNSDAVLDPGTATATLRVIKIADIDHDGVVDATDEVVRSDEVTGVGADTEVRVPLGGALRWTIRVTGIANEPVGATQVRIRYREVSE